MGLDELAQRDAHRLLDIARLFDMTRDAEDLGPLVLGTADAGKPGSTAAQNGRNDGNGLDIVDRGGTTVEPDRRREGRLEARLSLFAFEALEQRRLLAADRGRNHSRTRRHSCR